MNMREDIKELIKKHEGYRQCVYKCPRGTLTIGYGRNLENNGISVSEADYLLDCDSRRCEVFLIKYLDSTYHHLSECRRAVLISMVYNLGEQGFTSFKKMMLALKSADYQQVAKEMLDSAWAEQVGKRAVELAFMMLNDRY